MRVRFPGWRTGGSFRSLRYGTVVRAANRNVDPCWIFWAWNQDAICGSLARRLGLLAAVAPYELASQLAQLVLGVTISAMGVWRVVQRLGWPYLRIPER